jgi:chromosome partitioning protein
VIGIIGLEYICKIFDLSYKSLAEYLRITNQQVNDWVNGRRKIPENHLVLLERKFNIPASYFNIDLDEISKIRIQEIKLENDKRRYMNMKKEQKRISVINYKGGVGKTTLSLNLAAGLSRKGRVLLVDVDHQANLSRVLFGAKEIDEDFSIAAIFKSYTKNLPMPGVEIIQKSPLKSKGYPNIDVLPSIEELSETEFDIAEMSYPDDFQKWAKKTLMCQFIDDNNLENEYDYIVFDCPPATMYITQNALAASQSYIIPLIPSELSMRGLVHLINMINEKIYKRLNVWENMLRLAINNESGINTERNRLYNSFSGNLNLAAVSLNMVQVVGNTHNKYGCTDVHQGGIDFLKQLEKKNSLLTGKVLYDYITYRRIDIEGFTGEGMPVYEFSSEFKQLIDKLAKLI